MSNISIIHFLPIEHYPPVQNLIEFISTKNQVSCYSTFSQKHAIFSNEKVSIKRFKFFKKIDYLKFYYSTFIGLLRDKPDFILYYDTINAPMAWLYKKLISKRVKVCVHYHEYVSPEEYDNGMKLNKFIYKFIEKKCYKNAFWISQTNEFRKSLFCKDNSMSLEHVTVFPNYPSRKWIRPLENFKNKEVLKIIYVGYGLNPKGNYIDEFLEMLLNTNVKINLDLYLLNSDDISDKLKNFSSNNVSVKIKKAISYADLPNILKNYHTGLILYKPTSKNWKYNAPNKLFEYLTFKLNVIYPSEMIGVTDYKNKHNLDNVISIDFKVSNTNFDFRKLLIEPVSKANFYYEDIYVKFLNKVN